MNEILLKMFPRKLRYVKKPDPGQNYNKINLKSQYFELFCCNFRRPKMNFEIQYSFEGYYQRQTSFVVKSLAFNDSGKTTVTGAHQDGKYKTATKVTMNRIMLKKIPKELGLVFPAVQDLTISNCGIKKISREELTGFKNLQILNLSGNKIMQVPMDVFDDLKNLKTLSLADNLVMFIDIRMFTDMDKLEKFELNSERYPNLQQNASRVIMMKKISGNYATAPGMPTPSANNSALEALQLDVFGLGNWVSGLDQKFQELQLQQQLENQKIEQETTEQETSNEK
jgi:Leucine-rich repeat (LRR) protein